MEGVHTPAAVSRFGLIKLCCNCAITLLVTDRLWQNLPLGPSHNSIPLDTASRLGSFRTSFP